MNIMEAKEEIKRTAEIYLDKNEYGEYTIPFTKQRPVFMTGGPGIGKTAVVEQAASELNIALVSCSMAHYTRQSLMGLPHIAKKEYEGRVWQVPEYTVSEILAAVYEVMNASGKREGILFLDEINCVPEGLASAVHLFLQHRIFGSRRLPEGWIVVAAGTPPEYNSMAKKFGIAVADRLKWFQVEEDFGVWKAYAYEHEIHASVLSFLEMHKNLFYSVGGCAAGQEYVTARGWEDLSRAIRVYEKKLFPVDRKLISQYIKDGEAAREFCACYERFLHCQGEYPAEDILKGDMAPELIVRASKADSTEKIFLLEILLGSLNQMLFQTAKRERVIQRVWDLLQTAGGQAGNDGFSLYAELYAFHRQLQEERDMRQAANILTVSQKEEYNSMGKLLERYMEIAGREADTESQYLSVKKEYDRLAGKQNKRIADIRAAMGQALGFIRGAWGNGAEEDSFTAALAANGAYRALAGQLSAMF